MLPNKRGCQRSTCTKQLPDDISILARPNCSICNSTEAETFVSNALLIYLRTHWIHSFSIQTTPFYTRPLSKWKTKRRNARFTYIHSPRHSEIISITTHFHHTLEMCTLMLPTLHKVTFIPSTIGHKSSAPTRAQTRETKSAFLWLAKITEREAQAVPASNKVSWQSNFCLISRYKFID